MILQKWFESTKMILSLDSILNVRLKQTGDNLATLCGEKERQRSDAAFFIFFSQEKKIRTDRIRSPISTAWWMVVQYFDLHTKLSGCNRWVGRCTYTREPNSSFSPVRWQRDLPLSLDNTLRLIVLLGETGESLLLPSALRQKRKIQIKPAKEHFFMFTS